MNDVTFAFPNASVCFYLFINENASVAFPFELVLRNGVQRHSPDCSGCSSGSSGEVESPMLRVALRFK